MKVVWMLGGLGNQMFQYAFGKALETNGKNVIYDLYDFKNYDRHNGYEIEKVFGIKLRKTYNVFSFWIRFISNFRVGRLLLRIIKKVEVPTEQSNFHPELLVNNTFYFQGYWQTEKYFLPIRDLLLKEFQFPVLTDEANLKYLKLINNSNSVSIHVRRGDYLKYADTHPVQTEAYFRLAIDHVKKHITDPVFFIFSDDVDWVNENLNLENSHVLSHNNSSNSFKDMQLMSRCKNNIIANSSFSWWAAWLNQNQSKIVIAPKNWIIGKGYNPKDIWCPGWIVI
jgi:hypothetical protein